MRARPMHELYFPLLGAKPKAKPVPRTKPKPRPSAPPPRAPRRWPEDAPIITKRSPR